MRSSKPLLPLRVPFLLLDVESRKPLKFLRKHRTGCRFWPILPEVGKFDRNPEGLSGVENYAYKPGFFSSSAGFSAPGITFFNGAFFCSSSSGWGMGLRGSI